MEAGLPSVQLGQISSIHGSALALEVNGNLLVNVYLFPREHQRALFCADLDDWLLQIGWHKPHASLVCGDFNETFDQGWVSALLAPRGFYEVELDSTTSRWNGSKVIDFFLTDGTDLVHGRAHAVDH